MNFDNIVQQAIKEGMTKEELAKSFASSLDSYEVKCRKEAENARDAQIHSIESTLNDRINSKKIDLSDTGAIIWLNIVKDPNNAKEFTSLEKLEKLMAFISKDLSEVYNRYRTYERLENIFGPTTIKSKREAVKSGTGRKTEPKSDSEIIKEFFNMVGLG